MRKGYIRLETKTAPTIDLSGCDLVLTLAPGRPAALVRPENVDLERSFEMIGFNAVTQVHALREGDEWRVAKIAEESGPSSETICVWAREYNARILGRNEGAANGRTTFRDEGSSGVVIEREVRSPKAAVRIVEYFKPDEHGNYDLVAERWSGLVDIEEAGR